MSRTKRSDTYCRTFNQYKNDTIQEYNSYSWYHERYGHCLEKTIALYGTEQMNWKHINTKMLKAHSRKERRAFQRVEYSKSFRDWEYEFDEKIEKKLKRLAWCYD